MERLGWRAAVSLAVIVASALIITLKPARLGLDLRGGTQIVLETQDTDHRPVDGDTVSRTLEVLRRRVDQLGVAEPSLQRSGNRRIIVELPGVADPDEAVAVIGQTAQLTFHAVRGVEVGDTAPAPAEPRPEGEAGDRVLPDEDGQRIQIAPAALSGDAVATARARFDSAWSVEVEFRGDGDRDWRQLTGEAACHPGGDPKRRIAIVLDDKVISSPQVSSEIRCSEGISGGSTVITGNFRQKEAKELGLLIRAGALPVPVQIVEQRTVGPTLGDAAIQASVRAALIGAALTIAYMIVYYRLLGGLAALALVAYGTISFAALLLLGVTLTLPGLAGFVLAIGMAVDANVLVFERIKEEHASGATIRTSVRNGFRRAWTAIADSNATTVLAAGLLFFYASGAVRGFGITLSIGVAVSLFTALVLTRVFIQIVLRSRRLVSRPDILGMASGGRLRRWIGDRRPDLLGRSGRLLAFSAVLVLVALTGFAARGLEYGLEFSGGRLLEYDTAQRADLDQVRAAMAGVGFPRAVVQESGNGNITIRTPKLSDNEEASVQAAVESVGGQAKLVRDEFVGPTIGDELRRKAAIALGLALLAQLGYLAIRFRWTYGAAAVVAMFHDVALLLGIFAWLGKTADGVFLAALLTVIGYSVNDSVVIFDRIRELRQKLPREPLRSVVNEACLQTVPRTINTGLGALFILVALFALGGETLADFALALLIGILVGTYSSVFTAAPVLVALETWAPAPVKSSSGKTTSVNVGAPARKPGPSRPTATKRKRRK